MNLGGVADTAHGCVTVQRDLDRLEKMANRDLKKFSKGNCKIPHLRMTTPMHQYRLGAD